MSKIAKFLFLLLLYCSNISTAIFIYPLIYFIYGVTNVTNVNNVSMEWYNFGLILSIYELGRFFGFIMWDYLSHMFSKLFLIIMSLSLICILNISYFLSFNIYHILIIRFLSGFFNNIGKYSKEIYIQLGFKDKIQIIIFFISIICTIVSLIIPSLISINIIKEYNNLYNIRKIYKITFIFAFINILSIMMSFLLIFSKTLKIRRKKVSFIRLSGNFEKSENIRNIQNKDNTKNHQSIVNYKKRGIKHVRNLNLKIKKNIINHNKSRNSFFSEKMSSKRLSNKKEDESKLGRSINVLSRNKISSNETSPKANNPPIHLQNAYNIENKNNSKNKKEDKDYKKRNLTIIHILTEIADGLFLIWTLIILHIEYNGNCLYIAFIYCCLRLLGEIISFPINTIIIRKTTHYKRYPLKKFAKNIMIINIITFLSSFISNINLFMYYYYFLKNKTILSLLFFSLLIRNVFSIINIQLFKIVSAKNFNVHSNNMNILRKYKQYSGCVVKIIIFFIGSRGYYFIYNISFSDIQNKNNIKLSKLFSAFYFIVLPTLNNFILIIMSKYFM
jgi:hypothetical protein